MGRFKIIRLLIQLGPDAIKLLDFPGIEDPVKLRVWIIEALELLDEVADITETEADDAVVDALASIVASDAAWDGFVAIISMIEDLFDGDDIKVGADEPAILDVAEKVGIDPVTIISLVMMAMKAIRWFRERRKNR